MSQIVFFRQQRVDGAIRSGILIDDEAAFHLLEHENVDDPDPVLRWYITIAVSGDDLPDEPEQARDWLLSHGPAIRDALTKEGQSISAGIDYPSWPIRRVQVLQTLPGGKLQILTISYSAMQAIAAREMGSNLMQVAHEFDAILRALPRWEAVPASL